MRPPPTVHEDVSEKTEEDKKENEKEMETNKNEVLLEKQYMKESKPNDMGRKFSETPCLCILLTLIISLILCVLTSVTSMVSMKDLTYDEFLDIDHGKLEFI